MRNNLSIFRIRLLLAISLLAAVSFIAAREITTGTGAAISARMRS
jgi:hypothetical protein